MIRKILFSISIIFIILLSTVLVSTYFVLEFNRGKIEKYAITYAIKHYSIEKNKLKDNSLVNIGLEFLEKYEPDIKNKLSVADSIVYQSMKKIDQGDKKFLNELKVLSKSERKRILTISSLKDLSNPKFIQNYIGMKYIITLEEIAIEFQKFLLCNILLFIIILGVSKYRKLPDKVILVPLLLLMTSTLTSMYLYFFETNWFLKIIFGTYSGYGYLSGVLVIFILLNILTLEHRIR